MRLTPIPNQRPKACFLGYGLHPPWNEGFAISARNLARALTNEIDVTLVTLVDHTRCRFVSMHGEPRILTIGEHHLPFLSQPFLSRRPTSEIVTLPSLLAGLVEADTSTSFDVIHLFNVSRLLPSLMSKLFLRKKLIAHVFREFSFVETATAKLVSAYACSNERAKRILVRMGIPEQKVYLVPPVVDPYYNRMYQRVSGKKKASDLPIVMYLGNLHEDRFPEAFARTLGKISRRRSFQLFVYSPTTQLNFERAKVLEAILREEKVSHRIVVCNLDVKEKARALNDSDIVVFPFTRNVESKMVIIDPPLTLIEAMSLGKIVVCTQLLSISSIIKNGYNGYTVDPDSPSDIEVALENALDNAWGSGSLGKRAHDSVEGTFSPDSARRTLKRIYDDIFSGRK